MTVPVADRGHEVLGVYGTFVALTTLTIVLRIYCRTVLGGKHAGGWDDLLAVVAWAFFICFAAFSTVGVHHGTGQHAWNIHPATEIPVAIKFWWLCEHVYVVSNMAIKASIAVMLLRLAVSPTHRIAVIVTLVVTELFSAGFLIFFINQCQPVQYFYSRYTGGTGTCVDTGVTIILVYVYSAIICAGDWFFAILPCIMVWNLQMPRTQKALVGVILAMGAIASAATIARIPYIHNLSNESDFLYATTDVAIWSCSETGLAITAASCATLRPLFRTWFGSSAFNKSGPTSEGRRGTTPSNFGDHRSGTGVGRYDATEVDGYGRRGDAAGNTELRDMGKRGAMVEEYDSASFESVAPSASSTAHFAAR